MNDTSTAALIELAAEQGLDVTLPTLDARRVAALIAAAREVRAEHRHDAECVALLKALDDLEE